MFYIKYMLRVSYTEDLPALAEGCWTPRCYGSKESSGVGMDTNVEGGRSKSLSPHTFQDPTPRFVYTQPMFEKF